MPGRASVLVYITSGCYNQLISALSMYKEQDNGGLACMFGLTYQKSLKYK